jgi:hypothetical protein
MKCRHEATCTLPDGTDYQAIVDAGANIDNYEECLTEATCPSIDNFVRNKIIIIKLLNQKIDFYEF